MDGERVQLKMNDLDIFETSDCKSDYLEIRDGFRRNAPTLGRFCSSFSTPQTIVSTGNRMVINYVSSHMEHRGFAASYRLDYNYLF